MYKHNSHYIPTIHPILCVFFIKCSFLYVYIIYIYIYIFNIFVYLFGYIYIYITQWSAQAFVTTGAHTESDHAAQQS